MGERQPPGLAEPTRRGFAAGPLAFKEAASLEKRTRIHILRMSMLKQLFSFFRLRRKNRDSAY